MKQENFFKNDKVIIRATVGCVALLLIAIISISFDDTAILWGWSLVPSIINSICK